MGRYIDEILQPGEKVLFSTNAHWIFFLPAIVGWVVAIIFLVLSYQVPTGAPALLSLAITAIAAIAARKPKPETARANSASGVIRTSPGRCLRRAGCSAR